MTSNKRHLDKTRSQIKVTTNIIRPTLKFPDAPYVSESAYRTNPTAFKYRSWYYLPTIKVQDSALASVTLHLTAPFLALLSSSSIQQIAVDFIILCTMNLLSSLHYAIVLVQLLLENYIVPSPPSIKLWLHY